MSRTTGNRITQSERSMDDDDIYTTADCDLKEMKDVNISDDDLSIPTSTFTEELFSSTKDEEDDEMENGVRKLPTPHRRRRSFCCICQRVVTPLFFLFFVTLFLIYFFGDSAKIQASIPGADWLFASEALGEQYVWKGYNDGDGGLTLNIINALDTEWHTYFDVAVSDWDNGSPDALTLSSEVASAPDPDCTMVEGVLKMCNSNYGNTDWMGINEVLEFEGEIAASIGRMNDHFFSSAFGDHAKRQYTMCHEMGHGFGLPHTDTAMYNRNTGNCLDYTNRPKKNMRPGQVNYDRLVAVYGTVDNTTTTSSQGNTATPSGSPNSNSNTANDDNTNISDDSTGNNAQGNNGNTDDQNNGGQNKGDQNSKNNLNKDNNKNNGNRRRQLSDIPLTSQQRTIPSFVLEQLQEIRQEYHTTTEVSNRRYLISSSSSSITGHLEDHYKIDLGSGYTIHLHFLKHRH